MAADVHLTDHARKRLYERAAVRTPQIMDALGAKPVSKEPPAWLPTAQVKATEYFVHIDERTSAIISSRDPDRMRVVVTLLTMEGLDGAGPSFKRRW
jgi:hypothetical protein